MATARARAVVLLGLIGAVCGQPATAEEFVSDEWRFKATPYLWGISVDGHVTVKGQKSDVDMSFGDILSDLNFGFFGQGEARKGRLGVIVDALHQVGHDLAGGPLLGVRGRLPDGLELGLAEELADLHAPGFRPPPRGG